MLTHSEARLIHALKSRSGREKHHSFVVEGVRAVEDLVAAGIDLKFVVIAPSVEDSRRGGALVEALAANALVRRVREPELKALADTDTPQGVLAVAHIPRCSLKQLKVPERAVIVVVDAVQDPGNLGTLIRSADAFAATAVVALPGTVDYWNPKVVRGAAGSAFRVPLISDDADAVWDWLSTHQFAVCGTDMRGTNLAEVTFGERVALVVGNEGSGLRKETREHVNDIINIPMPGRAESLNVAIAAGILLYELSRSHR
jgi:RNA methyltransferase, TrmH family